MTKSPKPPPALFGEMPEQARPTSSSTDSHTRSRCEACKGRGQISTKARIAGVMQRTWADCSDCGGQGYMLKRISTDA